MLIWKSAKHPQKCFCDSTTFLVHNIGAIDNFISRTRIPSLHWLFISNLSLSIILSLSLSHPRLLSLSLSHSCWFGDSALSYPRHYLLISNGGWNSPTLTVNNAKILQNKQALRKQKVSNALTHKTCYSLLPNNKKKVYSQITRR